MATQVIENLDLKVFSHSSEETQGAMPSLTFSGFHGAAIDSQARDTTHIPAENIQVCGASRTARLDAAARASSDS